ncbi:MAG: TatD family hydrolase, partial [Candidatus Marinimicrobia bacterium]|nr:TatD family hydrolase [Candidatus Neomarinimicrobiota bacterium]
MLIDSHIHLDSKVYSDDLPEILIKANQSGVRKMITPGTSLESSAKCIRIAQENDGIYAAVGVHPHDADNAADDFVKRLEEMSSDETV